MEFPHIQQLYEEIRPQGGEVITISLPPVDSMANLMRSNNAILPVALEAKEYDDSTAIYKRYKAGVKVWYVIDSARKIHYVGNYNPAKIRAALGTLGVKWERKGKY